MTRLWDVFPIQVASQIEERKGFRILSLDLNKLPKEGNVVYTTLRMTVK